MERAGEEDFPYYFDEEAAELYCDFFPKLLRHSKGRFAGHPFKLSPWQTFIVWQLFGWKRSSDGFRRFRRLFKTVARKNGKSTFAAGLEIILTFADGEAGAEVYIGATKLEQAKIIHMEAERMVRKSSSLAKHALIQKNNLEFKQMDAFARPLGSDKAFDGLNPHGVFFDEMHAWSEFHRDFYNTMTSGSASRDQPLTVTVSTKGTDKSLIYNEELDYCRKVLDGDVVDDSLLAIVFELDEGDDCWDESKWIKANPGLGVSVSLEYLQQQANECQNKPSGKAKFERYHANRTVSSVESPITSEIWDSLSRTVDIKSADKVGCGVDLGGRDDLASCAFTGMTAIGYDRPMIVDGACPKCNQKTSEDECDSCEKETYRYESTSKSFLSENTERDLSEEPFATWIQEGKLEVCKYPITEMMTWMIETAYELGCSIVCYDPAQAIQFSEKVEDAGLIPIKMGQNHSQFNSTIEELFAAIKEDRFAADENDEVLKWAACNVAINTNPRGQKMCDKPKSKEKIDPFVAMLMSQRAAAAADPKVDISSLYVTTK